MLPPVPAWVSAFEANGNDTTPAWADKMANTVESLTTGMMEISVLPKSQFTFNKPTFKAGLMSVTGSTAPSGIKFATAFANAVLASEMIGSPGAGFATIAKTLVDPASVESAKAALAAALDSNPPGAAARQAFAKSFRAAFASLTYTLNGVSPAPSPLTLPNVPVK